ncbi:MAG: NUDIX domain-containing protein, partial [Bacteroidales bacterium]|nr:NUDIX domain-containing protein [Bacteroidales bacterium]
HDYETLKKLKGIGEYTAAAIASIGFNQPVPLMDGNVFRVVSRLFGIKTPIDTTAGKNEIRHALESFFDFEHAGNFNEAMMDFGAMQCTPTHPHCETCPCQSSCQAFITQKTDLYPIKLKQIPIKTRFLNYLVLQTSTQPTLTVLSQRTQKDIWKNLYEFPLIETTSLIDDATLAQFDFWKSASLFSTPPHFEKIIRKSQKLTHRQLHVSFTFATLPLNDISLSTSHLLLSITDLQQKPVPIILKKIIKEWL